MKRIIIVLMISLSLLPFNLSQGESDPDALSAVQLTSLNVDSSTGVNHLRLTVKARRAGNFEGIVDIKKAAQKSLEHFFIGLSVPNDVFWVNLNPDEPNRIINLALADTDLGRIMLSADYRLKEDVASVIDPRISKTGKEFWKRLYQKAEELGIYDKIPVVTRLWILPDMAEVCEKQNQLYITKSSLKVQLESAYLSQGVVFKNNKDKELQDFGSKLMEELVLPQLNKRINEAYAYADLRDVYNALILAVWYKDKFGFRCNSLLRTGDYTVLQDSETDYISTPEEIYRSYLKSIKEGKNSFSESESIGSPFYRSIITRHYFVGGVDFKDIRLINTSANPKQDNSGSDLFFSCDLFMPERINRPLQYAKNQIEVTRGINEQDKVSTIMLAKILPAIAPLDLTERNLKSIDTTGKAEQIVLSKL